MAVGTDGGGELWMPIEGFDGYEVSDRGRVRSLKRPTARVLTPTLCTKGYRQVRLYRQGRRSRQPGVAAPPRPLAGREAPAAMSDQKPKIVAPCPECPGTLELRINRRTGEEFLGCDRYPECRFTKPLDTYLRMKRAGAPTLFD